jgi:tetratricopeptide (TPR) repeat protein
VDGAIHLAVQLADALAHSHQCGIFHRDLKPSNVLMASGGRPLLLDFNLSVDARLSVCKIGGTLPYMAPEELATLNEDALAATRQPYDPRSDIFSLGVILYEILSGHLPFVAGTWEDSFQETASQLYQQQTSAPPPIRKLNDQVDARLARLVESCLAFDPNDRPQTASDLAAALRRELTWLPWSRRWVGNHRRLVAGAASVAAAAMLALAVFIATLPAYRVRQYQAGIACAKQGEHKAAIECFTNALHDDSRYVDALVARGREYQELGDFSIAFSDYDSAYALAPSPKMTVRKGYCLSRLNQNREALALYQQALQNGECSPELLNNVGYCCVKLNSGEEAEGYLRRAVALDDRLQAVHHNLMIVFLRRAGQRHDVPREAFLHVRRALEMGPPSAELYRDAASLYAIAARQDSTLVPQTIEYVQKAVEYGMTPKYFLSSVEFAPFRQDKRFETALAAPQSKQYPRAEYIVAPPEEP